MAGFNITDKMRRAGENKDGGMSKLTWYVSVTTFKGVEVVHEFFDRDFESFKQAGVFKEPVGDLRYQISNCQNQNQNQLYCRYTMYNETAHDSSPCKYKKRTGKINININIYTYIHISKYEK